MSSLLCGEKTDVSPLTFPKKTISVIVHEFVRCGFISTTVKINARKTSVCKNAVQKKSYGARGFVNEARLELELHVTLGLAQKSGSRPGPREQASLSARR